jgi:hypothetical protein
MKLKLSSVLFVAASAALALHCTFNPGPPTGNSITPGSGFAGNSGGGGAVSGLAGYSGECKGLQCQQSTCTSGNCTVPACAGGMKTTVSGTVYDPAGKVPLYGITVYVPNSELKPFVDGPSCDPCDKNTGTSLLSGDPITFAKTDVHGNFTLGLVGGDVPAGDNIPLVIQVGKWQRKVTIPMHVTACQDNPIADKNVTRLPRNQSEGHIPKIALTTGEKDAMECLLRKIGIDDTEFTPEAGAGRINLFAGGNGTASYAPTLNNGAPFTAVNPWWDSLDNLKKYDVILHSCEGSQGSYDGNNAPKSAKSPAARAALQSFADAGGRVFASHWHAYWFENGSPAFQSIATFKHGPGLPNPYTATIDQGFAQGSALASWMVNVGGSPAPGGTVVLAQDANTTLMTAAAGGRTSQRWIYAADKNPQTVEYLSATTPVPGGTCGRVVLSDIHVSSGGATSDKPATPFPMGCITTDLTPQEKVIEFMLFDISSCVQAIIP